MSTDEPIIAIIDVETTGTRTDRDQVIEFAVQKGLKNSSFEKSWRVKPSIPISAGAQKVHGISNEDVANCPPFKSLIPTVRKIIDGSDIIVGYNVSFDIDIIQHEFKRNGEKPLDLNEKTIIDPLRLWRRCEPRSLSDAVERFVGKKHSGAHAAAADVAATGEVLVGMKKEFGLADMDWYEIADFLNPDRKLWIGASHHIQWRAEKPVIGFGKHQGTALLTLKQTENDYLGWVLEKDFPEHVKDILLAVREKTDTEFVCWVGENYGTPPE